MTTELLFEIAWKSGLTLGLTLILLALLRRRSAAERSWIAHAGLAATLLMPLAIWTAPRWQVEAPAPVASVFATSEAAPAEPPGSHAVLTGADRATIDAPSGPHAPAEAGAHRPGEGATLLAYAIPAGLLLALTLVAILRLFALRGRADVLVEQCWLTALARAQQRMGFKHGTALLVSDDIASPVSWGLLRPVILLNGAAVGSRDHAEAIIAHELAHVARLDWAKLLLSRVVTALFWFNPLAWLLARQCHQLREEAADDSVLASDVPDLDYAELLVGVARHESGALFLAANGVAPGRGSLLRRVERVLDASLRRAPPRSLWTVACVLGALLVTAPLAALSLTVSGSATAGGVDFRFAAATGDAARAEPFDDSDVDVDADIEAAVETALAVASAAASAVPATLDRSAHSSFNAISLQGGGEVIIRYGANRSVRTIRGNPRIAISDDNIAVQGGNAVVEVVMPRLEAISVDGDGSVRVRGTFPPMPELVSSVTGGGSIDVQAVDAGEVAASVRNGGTIKTRVRNELAASVSGGGSIVYWGNPRDVASAANGGGSIEHAGR